MIFFVSLLFACLSLTNAALPSMMQDPKQFIQTLEGANPKVLKDMIDMVNKLIDEGEEERKKVIAAQDAAQVVFNEVSDYQAKAEDARNVAAGKVKNQQEVTRKATEAEISAKNIRDDEKTTLDTLTSKAESAAAFKASEIIRIDSEKALLNQIIAKLQKLLPGVTLIEGRLSVTDYIVGRSLLSESNADRDAVQAVVDKVNAMVGRGERQRASAIAADKAAQSALAAQKVVYQTALDNWRETVRVLGQAKSLLASLESDLAVKESSLKDANKALKEAKADLKAKTDTRISEEKRLNAENQTLNEVLVLLKKLLKASQ